MTDARRDPTDDFNEEVQKAVRTLVHIYALCINRNDRELWEHIVRALDLYAALATRALAPTKKGEPS